MRVRAREYFGCSTFHAVFAACLFTLVLHPAPVRAASAAEISRLIDAYARATGGRTALARERTIHLIGRVQSMGMSGTIEQWIQHPDKLLIRLNLGPIRTRTGYDGQTGWRTDLNSKKVTLLDGKDLEALQAEAWFENERWVDAQASGGKFTVGNLSFRDGDTYRALDVTPPIGPSRRLWISPKTGVLDRIVSRRDQHEWEQWVGEWQPAGDRKRWTVQTSTQPQASGANRDPDLARWEERVTIDSMRVDADLDSGFFSPPGGKPKSVAWIKSQGRLEVPFRYGTRHVWIKASINGAPPADFLLDTGCSITAIDRAYAERIGLESEGAMAVQGVSGTGEGAFARVKSLRIGGAPGTAVAVRDLKAGIVDLGESMEAVLWRKAAGLIGYDVLSHFVVEIDYDRERVTFHDPATYRYQGKTEPIPMRLMSGIPTIQVTLDGGCTGEFIVDVGNSFGLDVHGSMVRRCQMLSVVARRKQVEVYSGGIGGSAVNWLTRLERIRIGPHEWSEPVAGLSLGSRGLIGSKDYSGNIGNGVLERFTCTFDYERRLLYLEPGRRSNERDAFSRSGTFLVRHAGRVYPGQIVRGSPAHQAGLKVLDQIMTIDGREAASFTPEELDRMLVNGAAGTMHTLTIERDGEKRTLTLTLEDVL